MAQQQEVRLEDVASVGSRVSWQAILAGSVIAVAIHLLLTLFAAAIGLSLTHGYDQSDSQTWARFWAAVVAAVFCICVALFCGGWVTSLMTVGETRREAVIHGILMWSVASFLMIGLLGLGFRAGYQGLMAAAYQDGRASSWDVAAQAAGVPPEIIAEGRRKASEVASDPEQARRLAAAATWATLAGLLLSLGTSVFGALSGAGPQFQLLAVRTPIHRRDGALVGAP